MIYVKNLIYLWIGYVEEKNSPNYFQLISSI